MKIKKQERREAKELFRSCVNNGLLDEARARQAVTAVLAQKPRGYVAILSHLQRLVKLDVDRRTARVESAAALSSEQQAAMQASLAAEVRRGAEYLVSPEPRAAWRLAHPGGQRCL